MSLTALSTAAALALALLACDTSLSTATLLAGQLAEEQPAPPPPPEESGVTALTVSVAAVEAHMTGGGWLELPTESSVWEILADPDLSEVGFGVIPAGSYTQIRILVAWVQATIDGDDVTLTVPSGTVKLVGEKFDVVTGEHLQISVLFDPEHSVVEHEDGSYHLKPVVRYEVN